MKLLVSRSHTFISEKPKAKAYKIRGAVPLKATDNGLTNSKVQTVQKALDIRQTERLRNQRVLYAGHTTAHLCTDGHYRILCTSWCV